MRRTTTTNNQTRDDQRADERAQLLTASTEADLAPVPTTVEPLERLNRDLMQAATTLQPSEVRWLVSLYYEMQEQRIRAAAQMREAEEQAEPNALVSWMLRNYATLENDIRRTMDTYSQSKPAGQWLRSITGIGPVLAAGLMAHVDITATPSPSALWSLAGLNPEARWDKGQKRPWNAKLKVLAWKCGQSFVKMQNRPTDIYGHVYATRKRYEQERNEQGLYAEQAARALTDKRIGRETVAYGWYTQGKLPPAQIQQRAERYATKLFFSHYFSVLHDLYVPSRPQVQPWIIAHGGHTDLIPVPNWPLPGLGQDVPATPWYARPEQFTPRPDEA